ncbi:MAG: hypothetical protein AAGI10_07935 [Pseudomonadota bacterium]
MKQLKFFLVLALWPLSVASDAVAVDIERLFWNREATQEEAREALQARCPECNQVYSFESGCVAKATLNNQYMGREDQGLESVMSRILNECPRCKITGIVCADPAKASDRALYLISRDHGSASMSFTLDGLSGSQRTTLLRCARQIAGTTRPSSISGFSPVPSPMDSYPIFAHSILQYYELPQESRNWRQTLYGSSQGTFMGLAMLLPPEGLQCRH